MAARSGLSSVPPALRRNVVGAWGAAGERWLADLPRLAASVARDWELELVPDHDEEATAILAGVARRPHRPPARGCPLPDLASITGLLAEPPRREG